MFALFEVTFLFRFSSLSSNSDVFVKSMISALVAKLVGFNLGSKLYFVNLLNS